MLALHGRWPAHLRSTKLIVLWWLLSWVASKLCLTSHHLLSIAWLTTESRRLSVGLLWWGTHSCTLALLVGIHVAVLVVCAARGGSTRWHCLLHRLLLLRPTSHRWLLLLLRSSEVSGRWLSHSWSLVCLLGLNDFHTVSLLLDIIFYFGLRKGFGE